MVDFKGIKIGTEQEGEHCNMPGQEAGVNVVNGVELANPAEVSRIVKMRNVAVLGASNKPDRASYRVMKGMHDLGYNIIPVNPGLAAADVYLFGKKVAATLADIEEEVDCVDVFRRAEALPDIWEEVKARMETKGDVKGFWGQQTVVDSDVAKQAREAGLDTVMDLCLWVEARAQPPIWDD